MSNLIPEKHKYLTLNDRLFIERSLDDGKPFREIAKYLCKNPSTISDEVWKNRAANTWNRGSFTNPYSFCIHRFRCKKKRMPVANSSSVTLTVTLVIYATMYVTGLSARNATI